MKNELQPIELKNYGRVIGNTPKDNKELKKPALEIFKGKMYPLPQVVCLASYENKSLSPTDIRMLVVHLVYLERESAHNAAVDLFNKYHIYPLGSKGDEPCIAADMIVKMVAPNYKKVFDQEVFLLRYRVGNLATALSISSGILLACPKPEELVASTPSALPTFS